MSPITITILTISVGILLAGGLIFLGLLNTVFVGDDLRERLDTFAVVQDTAPRRQSNAQRTRLLRMRRQMNSMLSVLASQELNLQLISANWPITESEYLLIRFGITALALAFGWLLFMSPISGIGLALLAFFIPPIVLQRSIQMRRTAFERQLIDVLVLITGAVRAGYSLQQALDVVVREMRAPASEEFKRVIYEVSLGLPLNQALNNLHDRMANDDLYLLVTAININYQVGGNLATMLDAVTKTIRERIRLFGEVRALTSQQRYNSYILSLLPIAFVAILSFLNPSYIQRLIKPGITLCFPIGAGIFIIIGNIVIRRLSKIEV
jgi:tight adherence protein B